MIEQKKRCTAKEYRDLATQIDDECADAIANDMTIASEFDVDSAQHLRDMLRQAADAEEENAQLKASKERWMQYQETAAGERNACIDELRKKDADIAQLKAQLVAVVKECEILKSISGNIKLIPEDFDAILRAARGKGGAE